MLSDKKLKENKNYIAKFTYRASMTTHMYGSV